VNQSDRDFRINVGFLINQPIGYYRDIPFEFEHYTFDESLSVDQLKGVINLNRTQTGLRMLAEFECLTQAECGRCLQDFDLSLKTQFEEIFTLENYPLSEDEQIIPESRNIDFRPYIRDYILIEIPINPVCEPDCRGLCKVCGQNLNLGECEHERSAIRSGFARGLLKSQNNNPYPGKNAPITQQ
jgi:uncharacterized protein